LDQTNDDSLQTIEADDADDEQSLKHPEEVNNNDVSV
jgi:hypothetical protein